MSNNKKCFNPRCDFIERRTLLIHYILKLIDRKQQAMVLCGEALRLDLNVRIVLYVRINWIGFYDHTLKQVYVMLKGLPQTPF
jgi:hypothetical protein